MPVLNIGCSGFYYDHWREVFYPADLPKKNWFEHYTKIFTTVELNTTFYHLPDKEIFNKWYTETPEDFVFSVKGSRFITHTKKLKAAAEPVDVFFSRVLALKSKLGVILWQLPQGLKADAARLAAFLELLRPYKTRNAFEFREKTWLSKKVISLLERENASLCMADSPDFIRDLPATADFVYIRRHGNSGNKDMCYMQEHLQNDAVLIRKYMKQKKDVYFYFNNDAAGCAPKNAAELIKILGR